MNDELHTLSGAYAVHALPYAEWVQFERHLHACAGCAAEVRRLRETAARLAEAVAEPPPARLRARLLDAAHRSRGFEDEPQQVRDDSPTIWRAPGAFGTPGAPGVPGASGMPGVPPRAPLPPDAGMPGNGPQALPPDAPTLGIGPQTIGIGPQARGMGRGDDDPPTLNLPPEQGEPVYWRAGQLPVTPEGTAGQLPGAPEGTAGPRTTEGMAGPSAEGTAGPGAPEGTAGTGKSAGRAGRFPGGPDNMAGQVAGTPGGGRVVPLRRRRTRLMAALTAVSVAAAVALGVVAFDARRDLGDMNTRDEVLTSVLAAPDAEAMRQPITTGGSGMLVISRTQGRMLFATSGLPELPTTKGYEVWLMGPKGPRSGGMLHRRKDGKSPPMVLTPQDGDQHVALTVEPASGSKKPTTGPIMLAQLPGT
ncbi:anti-sigma factor [Nonomuraea sp. NPDC050404]|uniref:anti-sigma factor n=1 Tax=Nonomuraea sp. NPDC050404 TaxID=3155783 RepID=UPI0033FE3065